jgi:hypothetical protein
LSTLPSAVFAGGARRRENVAIDADDGTVAEIVGLVHLVEERRQQGIGVDRDTVRKNQPVALLGAGQGREGCAGDDLQYHGVSGDYTLSHCLNGEKKFF